MSSPETLTQADFDARYEDGELSVAFVAMSGMGKTKRSLELEQQAGFRRVSIDDLIEARLVPLLEANGFHGGIDEVARWMGQPYEPRSPENQQRYLGIEVDIMREIIEEFANPPLGGNLVVDTTGSVVHTGEAIATDLRQHSTVVYLEGTEEKRQEMFQVYMDDPKPVIWGDAFSQAPGESERDALARSYPELLGRRAVLYEQMAQVTIPYAVSRRLSGAAELLEYVRHKLPTSYANSASYTPRQ